MKFNRLFFFVLLASMAVFLTACGAAPATNWPGLATDGTHVYLAEGQYVYKILVSDGTEVKLQTGGDPVNARFPLKAENTKSFYAAPLLTEDGQLVIGSAAQSEHTLYSIDPNTINIKWTFTGLPSPWVAGAASLNGNIYAPAGDGKLYAFDKNGAKLWDFPAGDHSLWTTPVTDGKLIFLATLNHELYAISPEGSKVWSATLDNGIVGAPGIKDGILYVGTLSGNLYAINAADGKQIWVKTLEGGIWGTPAVDGTNLYIGTVTAKTGKFYALKIENGDIAWSKDEEGSITAGPLLANDQIIYVTEAGRIQSVDQAGTPKWQATIENAKLYTPPFFAGDLILIAPMNANFLLAAYDLNGAQKWTFTGK